MTKPTVRPLLVRSGARYTCFGDGLCCTDMHGLGPLTKKEVRALEVISEGVVIPGAESGFDEPMLRTRDDGGCLFLGEDRCDLHAALGADAKPAGCRRFPLGLVATPSGGRITTRHRCPCRTLGDRPELTADAALPSLLDKKGRPSADDRVGPTIAITRRKSVPWEEWERIEAALIERLLAGEDPMTVLDAAPFPALKGTTWKKQAAEMLRDGADDTRFGRAIEHFAVSIQVLLGGKRTEVDPLAWEDAFDRAQARTERPEDPVLIFADWIADEIWALGWTDHKGTFARCRADLVTRYAIARDIEAHLQKEGRREDRAAAEAVAVVDLLGDSEWWEDISGAIRV